MMKKCVSLLLLVCILSALCVPAFARTPEQPQKARTYSGQFTDVPDTSWCAEHAKTVYEYGLMGGTSDTIFNPEGSLSVAAAIAIACRMRSLYDGDHFTFTSTGEWYQVYVDYAIEKGILKAEETYAYTAPVTRAQFALFISNSLPEAEFPALNDIKEGDIPDLPASSVSPFQDAADALEKAGILQDEDLFTVLLPLQMMSGISEGEDAAPAPDENRNAIYRLYQAGILTGNDAYGTFTPDASITRGSAAAILSRVLEPSLRKQITLEKKPVTLVPVDQLANRTVRKRASQAELAQAYEKAKKYVEPLAGLSREAQLYGIAIALRVLTEHEVDYSMSAPHYDDPYGFFVLHTSSCAGCTRATGLCLNMLGIPYEHVNENQYTHQWARVNVNGTYWICDAYGLYCGPEKVPYQHPMFS